MDPMMMGLTGTLVGAVVVAGVGVVKSVTETWLPGVVANTDTKRQMHVNLQSQRYDTVKGWRAGLEGACSAYRQWAAGPRDSDPPNVVGDEWFEGLRPYLPTDGDAAQFRSAHGVHCDNPTVIALSLEIGRIEQEWIDEAHGRPRRGGNRPS